MAEMDRSHVIAVWQRLKLILLKIKKSYIYLSWYKCFYIWNSAIGEIGEILIIRNISRYSEGIFECVATNGVQEAITKEIEVEVQCMFEFSHFSL